MLTIFKYVLQIADEQVLKIKGCIEVLSVMEQYDMVVLYTLVDTEATEVREVSICIVGTGHPAAHARREGYRFLGTVKLLRGHLVWHVFCKGSGPSPPVKRGGE